ncbi:MAG: hypothetical protein CL920_17600 [Deltaproteobacteria bacterium]|nr:hypothetical protein [Deltaproteobacteria bacterium]MBU50494.1 hypothetical protein [Deltaproteobacteria bacterium]
MSSPVWSKQLFQFHQCGYNESKIHSIPKRAYLISNEQRKNNKIGDKKIRKKSRSVDLRRG